MTKKIDTIFYNNEEKEVEANLEEKKEIYHPNFSLNVFYEDFGFICVYT